MKNIFRFTITILIIIVFNNIHSDSLQVQTYLATDKTFNSQINPITHQQTKAQVDFFKEALDELGATSPEQVISIWFYINN